MSAQARVLNHGQLAAQEPDLIDRIAQALPESLRADYYREMAHCRTLPENDEMLRILRAMQFLTVLIEQAPGRVATEREQLAEVLARAISTMQATHEAGLAYQKQLEARLAKLPEEIAQGISAEAIAAKLTESLRQQFQLTGLPAVADAIRVQAAGLSKASKELSIALDEFSHPRHGAVPLLKDAISSMKANLGNAADHIRAQMSGLGKELWRTIAVLFAAGVCVGVLITMLYYRWISSPVEPASAAAPQVQSAPAPTPVKPQGVKTRQHSIPRTQAP